MCPSSLRCPGCSDLIPQRVPHGPTSSLSARLSFLRSCVLSSWSFCRSVCAGAAGEASLRGRQCGFVHGRFYAGAGSRPLTIARWGSHELVHGPFVSRLVACTGPCGRIAGGSMRKLLECVPGRRIFVAPVTYTVIVPPRHLRRMAREGCQRRSSPRWTDANDERTIIAWQHTHISAKKESRPHRRILNN
ncbi:hypothetical protein FKP32DRAFT_835125 [Trametes sanguinea]|nr:hypothetical protein FKP32DRAFT_835125 [Trametes sanguinea]